MPSCPSGHHSTAIDVCDVCGFRLRAHPVTGREPRRHPTPPLSPARAPAPRRPSSAPRGGPCPECGTSRAGRFCEECGYDFASRSVDHPDDLPGPGRTHWRAIVAADPAYYQYMVYQGRLDPDQISFPAGSTARRVTLKGERVHIGRRSASRGFTPEIDLGGPRGDPAISHVHAVLVAKPDGTWALRDAGSTNGTTVNGTANPLTPDVEVPLHDNDRIYVGAWTVIIVRKG